MIKINCTAPEQVRLHCLTPFQGELKKRTPQDIEALSTSLLEEGMMMPFAVWTTKDEEGNEKRYLLDGHGRLEALIRLSMRDPSLLEQEFPCLSIEAEDVDSARKALCQITSMYGRINKKGVVAFTATIPDYKAPMVCKARGVLHRVKKVKSNLQAQIRIRVPIEREAELRALLSKVDFIEVL